MAYASGSSHGLTYIEETSFGVPPTISAGDMTYLRHEGCSLGLSKDSFQSNELRQDRMISDLRHGMKRSGGGIDIEFSLEEYDALLEGALFGSWSANVLKAGTTRKSFAFERQFADIGQYGWFTGQMVNGFSLNISPNGMVRGSFSLVGKDATYSSTTKDATPAASKTASPFDGFTGSIKEGGAAIAIVTGLSFSLSNGLTPANVLFQNTAMDAVPGRSNLTGSVTAYFDGLSMLNKFINETESSLEFSLSSGTKGYTFLIPRIKYSGADNPTQGEGPITLTMPWQALLDKGATATNMQITRDLT